MKPPLSIQLPMTKIMKPLPSLKDFFRLGYLFESVHLGTATHHHQSLTVTQKLVRDIDCLFDTSMNTTF